MPTTAAPPLPVAAHAHAAATGTVWTLPHGGLHTEHLSAGENLHLTCLTGECWITLEGDETDYVISAGESLSVSGPGLLLIEAVHGSVKLRCVQNHPRKTG